MSSRTLSFRRGQGYLAHNRRVFTPQNVNAELSSGNRVYAREELVDAYEALFGDAIRAYDKKERHTDRKIRDANGYIRKLENSGNGEEPWYELVVQIGDLYDCGVGTEDGSRATKILDEYMLGFQERNPHLHVFDACMHVDEQTPHLHIDVIPVAEYAKGMRRRNSWTRALAQQGFSGKNRLQNSTVAWQESERDALTEIMERSGWTRTHVTGEKRDHLTVSEYKAAVANDLHALDALPQEIPVEKRNERRGTVVITKNTLAEMISERRKVTSALMHADSALDEAIRKERASYVAARSFGDRSANLARREQEAANLESKVHDLTEKNKELTGRVLCLTDRTHELESVVNFLSQIGPVLANLAESWTIPEPMKSTLAYACECVDSMVPAKNLDFGPYTTVLKPVARRLADEGAEFRFDCLSSDQMQASVVVDMLQDNVQPFVLADGFASLDLARKVIGGDIPITRMVQTHSELLAAYEREAQTFVEMVQSTSLSKSDMEWLRGLLQNRLVEPVVLSDEHGYDMLYPQTFQMLVQRNDLESREISASELAAVWMTANLQAVRLLEKTARAREQTRRKEIEQEKKLEEQKLTQMRKHSGWDWSR